VKKTTLLIGVTLIFIVTVLQALGFCNPLEQGLIHALRRIFPALLPQAHRTVLLSFESSPGGFPSMDVAMALRGLGELHPRSLLIDGTLAPENGPVPFLPSLFTRLKEADVTLLVPQPAPSASASTRFRAVPLARYSLGPPHPGWPILPGKAVPGIGNAFLPESRNAPNSLPLFSSTSDGSTIGSLWWWALPAAERQTPFLLFGKLLLLGNHAPLRLTPTGETLPSASSPPESFMEIPLDDFLLRMEQRDQGILSPSFDGLWNNATVVLGTHDNLPEAAAMAALLDETSWRHLALGTQILLACGWSVLFFLVPKFIFGHRNIPGWLLPLLIVIVLSATTLVMLHLGTIIPFLPGLLTTLLLVIGIFPRQFH
jgi:hypothetical protein